MVEGHFEPSLAHISPCKFPKSCEMGNCRTDSAYRWGLSLECVRKGLGRGVQGRGAGGGVRGGHVS